MTRPHHDTEPLATAIQAAVADIRAPAPLRARIEAERESRRAPRRRSAPVLALAGGAAVLACSAVLVLVIGLLGGDENRVEGPTMALAADATLRPASGPAPEEDAADPVLLRAGINGLRFPYWDEFGLEGTAVRREAIGGRRAMTVVYEGRGQRIGYTIIAGPAIAIPEGARQVRRGSLPLSVLERSGATVVTWRRAGHTCVLASRQADARRLLQLAAWTGGGRIAGYRR
jgi:hypothetical protein